MKFLDDSSKQMGMKPEDVSGIETTPSTYPALSRVATRGASPLPVNDPGMITTVGLYITAIVFLTLKLYFSAIMNFITGTLWLILLSQRIKYKGGKK